MRILKFLIIPIPVIFAFAIFLLWVPLPKPCPSSFSKGRNLYAAIATGIMGLIYVAAVVRLNLKVFFGAGRFPDPIFTSMGMAAKSYQIFGRSYHGKLHGRDIDVLYFPGQAARRPLFEVSVYGKIGLRMSVGARSPLLDCIDCPVLSMDNHELPGLEIRAQDERQAGTLLLDHRARDAVKCLAGGDDSTGYRELYLQPKRVWLRCHPTGLSGGEIHKWLGAAITLANDIETIEEEINASREERR